MSFRGFAAPSWIGKRRPRPRRVQHAGGIAQPPAAAAAWRPLKERHGRLRSPRRACCCRSGRGPRPRSRLMRPPSKTRRAPAQVKGKAKRPTKPDDTERNAQVQLIQDEIVKLINRRGGGEGMGGKGGGGRAGTRPLVWAAAGAQPHGSGWQQQPEDAACTRTHTPSSLFCQHTGRIPRRPNSPGLPPARHAQSSRGCRARSPDPPYHRLRMRQLVIASPLPSLTPPALLAAGLMARGG
jgi:hypothetical protein